MTTFGQMNDNYYDPTYGDDGAWDSYADDIYPEEPTQIGFEAWIEGKHEEAEDRAIAAHEERMDARYDD